MRSNLKIFRISKREFRMNSSSAYCYAIFLGGGGGGGGKKGALKGNWKVENDVSKMSSAS